MQLGDAVQITIGVPDVEEALSFYQKVGDRRGSEVRRTRGTATPSSKAPAGNKSFSFKADLVYKAAAERCATRRGRRNISSVEEII
jgi:hypothetical protein